MHYCYQNHRYQFFNDLLENHIFQNCVLLVASLVSSYTFFNQTIAFRLLISSTRSYPGLSSSECIIACFTCILWCFDLNAWHQETAASMSYSMLGILGWSWWYSSLNILDDSLCFPDITKQRGFPFLFVI